MLSLTDITDRLASIRTGITHIQIGIYKIPTYLKTLATHTIFQLKLPPSVGKYKKRNCMTVSFALPNDHKQIYENNISYFR